MSYSPIEAKNEFTLDIALARKSVDAPERLEAIAKQAKKRGEDELAEALQREAHRIEWSYDEARDNEL